MDLKLSGKVAAITGGASGIGRALADSLAQEGCRIAICDINKENLEEAVSEFEEKGVSVYCEVADVSSPEDMNRFAQNTSREYGQLDLWMNNAGTILIKPLLDLSYEEWSRIIRIDLDSVFLGTQAAAKEMIKTGGGAILNTSSINAVIPTSNKASYAVAKAGVVTLTKASAAELAPYNIRVNSILPGFVSTKLMEKRLAGPEREKFLSLVPNQRIGTPEDIADLCTFLFSERARHITGAAYEITGGMFASQDPLTPWGR